METQSFDFSAEAMPFLAPFDESGARATASEPVEEAAPKKNYRPPRVVKGAQANRETVLRLIEGVKLL